MRVAPTAQAAEFAANILPIIRMTGIGPVAVRCPHVRDRVDEGSERIRFSSSPSTVDHSAERAILRREVD
jgi:hypothetical protein